MKAFLVLLIGWLADRLLGDPSWLPHPIVGFGKIIALFERLLNRGRWRKFKGAVVALVLIAATFVGFWFLLRWIDARSVYIGMAVKAVFVFYCLAGTTLIREVREVFHAVDRSLEEGRRQVARIVGRDTSQLSAQEVRTAALETLAENLSDGVVAPLFWYALLGVPGMMTYKMINTLDSMIGYKTERWLRVLPFVTWFGRQNASPNSGYPEAALAGILDCRFGGPHTYFGEYFEKPYIGTKARELTTADMELSVRINRRVENLSVVIILIVRLVRFAILYVFFW